MFISEPTIEGILTAVKKLNLSAEELIVLNFGEHAEIDFPKLIEALKEAKVNFIGALFPQVIYDTNSYKQALVINRFTSKHKPIIVKDMSKSIANFSSQFGEPTESQTALIYVDGLSADIATFLSNLYDSWGNVVNYIGGGAGSLSLEQQPCLLTKDGFLEDAALVVVVEHSLELSVRHGWETLEGPIIATNTEKNVIKELNWMPAFDVYKEIVEADSGHTFNDENFFDLAKSYPFGMSVNNQEAIVRDPIMCTEDGALVCVGKVDENAVLEILKGKPNNLVTAAKEAVAEVLTQTQGKDLKAAFVVDCISRVLFLEDDFNLELEAVYAPFNSRNNEMHLTGILTLGEISSNGRTPIYLYNKTMVLGAFLE